MDAGASLGTAAGGSIIRKWLQAGASSRLAAASSTEIEVDCKSKRSLPKTGSLSSLVYVDSKTGSTAEAGLLQVRMCTLQP